MPPPTIYSVMFKAAMFHSIFHAATRIVLIAIRFAQWTKTSGACLRPRLSYIRRNTDTRSPATFWRRLPQACSVPHPAGQAREIARPTTLRRQKAGHVPRDLHVFAKAVNVRVQLKHAACDAPQSHRNESGF